MKLQDGRNINEFEQGDILTRVKPAILGTDELGELEEQPDGTKVMAKTRDYSYRGDRLRLFGIANNMIYLENLDYPYINKYVDLDFERWFDG